MKEWALCSESSENWDGKLQSAQPPQVIEVLLSVPVEKGMNYRLWGGENGFCYLHTDACISNWKISTG